MFKCFKSSIDTIEELGDNLETSETTGAVQTLLSAMCDISFWSFQCLWNNILDEDEVNYVQNYLQILEMSFEKICYQNEV